MASVYWEFLKDLCSKSFEHVMTVIYDSRLTTDDVIVLIRL